jgi:Macrocin-O-methyltransferase (TylF)
MRLSLRASAHADRDPKFPAKVLLTELGSRLGPSAIYNLNGCFNYLHAGWWFHWRGFGGGAVVHSRLDVFDRVATEVAGRRVLYLEFGVAAGNSMRYWSGLLDHPEARLHGFDSFWGLPHDWTLEGHPRGTFSTRGVIPQVDDPRVEFFPGRFEDTLPEYEWPEHDVLVAVLDADLYTSTATALSFLGSHFVTGSFLYFDQLHHRCDELRALNEFLDEHLVTLRVVARTRELSSVAFQRTA